VRQLLYLTTLSQFVKSAVSRSFVHPSWDTSDLHEPNRLDLLSEWGVNPKRNKGTLTSSDLPLG